MRTLQISKHSTKFLLLSSLPSYILLIYEIPSPILSPQRKKHSPSLPPLSRRTKPLHHQPNNPYSTPLSGKKKSPSRSTDSPQPTNQATRKRRRKRASTVFPQTIDQLTQPSFYTVQYPLTVTTTCIMLSVKCKM